MSSAGADRSFIGRFTGRKKKTPPKNPLEGLTEGTAEYDKAMLSDEYESYLDWEAKQLGITFDPSPLADVEPGSKEEAEILDGVMSDAEAEAELARLESGEEEPELTMEQLEAELEAEKLAAPPPPRSVDEMVRQAAANGIHFSDKAVANMKEGERWIENANKLIASAREDWEEQMAIQDAITRAVSGDYAHDEPTDEELLAELAALEDGDTSPPSPDLEAPGAADLAELEDLERSLDADEGDHLLDTERGKTDDEVPLSPREAKRLEHLEKRIDELSSKDFDKLSPRELNRVLKKLDKYSKEIAELAKKHNIDLHEEIVTEQEIDDTIAEVLGTSAREPIDHERIIREAEEEAARDGHEDEADMSLGDDDVSPEEVDAVVGELTGQKPEDDDRELTPAQREAFDRVMAEVEAEARSRHEHTETEKLDPDVSRMEEAASQLEKDSHDGLNKSVKQAENLGEKAKRIAANMKKIFFKDPPSSPSTDAPSPPPASTSRSRGGGPSI